MDRGAWRATVHGFTESDTHIGNKDPHMLRGAANTHTHTHTPHPKQLQNYTNDEDCRGEISSVQSLSYVRLFRRALIWDGVSPSIPGVLTRLAC